MSLLPRSSFFNSPFDFMDSSLFHTSNHNFLKCDIYEKDGKYRLEVDIPGFKKEDIQMDYKNGYLTICAVKKHELEENETYIQRERFYGEYERSFYIGNVNEEDIKAKFEDGTLKVEFTKEIEEKKRQIEIE